MSTIRVFARVSWLCELAFVSVLVSACTSRVAGVWDFLILHGIFYFLFFYQVTAVIQASNESFHSSTDEVTFVVPNMLFNSFHAQNVKAGLHPVV